MIKKRIRKILLILVLVVIVISTAICLWRFQDRDYRIVLQEQVGTTETQPSTIKVGTYNIKSLDNGNATSSFVNDVKDLDLDIIVLQEVDRNASRSNYLDMVSVLGEEAGYEYYYFYKSMWIISGDYGLGILSKYPILEVESHELPNATLAEPRILAGAVIDINGFKLTVYNTHLTYFNRSIRSDQVNFISDLLMDRENTMLLGDMNNFTIEDIYSINGYQQVTSAQKQFITFRGFAFVDNIYVSNNMQILSTNMQNTTFSDHNILWCEISLHKEGSGE